MLQEVGRMLKDWVDKQYDHGRVAYISKEELLEASTRNSFHTFFNHNRFLRGGYFK